MTILRAYRADDLDALYQISLATGFAGADASHLYGDPKLMGHIYSAPYAILDPDFVTVAVDEEGVGGFVLGTDDTLAWEERLEREWWPGLRAHYEPPSEADRSSWTPDQRRVSMIFDPEKAPSHIRETYPAHLHINLLPRLQGQGVGSKLLAAWLEAAKGRGAEAVHVGVNRANVGALAFWRKQGFVETETRQPEGRTIWLGRLLAG